MAGLAGIATLTSGADNANNSNSFIWAALRRQALFGAEASRIDVAGACIGFIDPADYPDPFSVQVEGQRVLIAQARPLRISGDAVHAGPPALHLLRSWKSQGPSVLSRVEGDFLLLDWDGESRCLRIARAPLSEFGLYVHHSGQSVRWATLAPAFGVKDLNLGHLANRLSDKAIYGAVETIFAGVEQVAPGSLTTIDASGKRQEFFWKPEDDLEDPKPDSYAADRLREALLEATRELTEGTGSLVASHLSAGRDSGAVTAAAAHILAPQGRSVLACTSVPRPGYASIEDIYLYDEGPASAQLAAYWSNIEHRKVQLPKIALGALLDRYNQVSSVGHGTPTGLPWWSAILSLAEERGARTLLSGGMGNLTISSGGPWVLPDLLAKVRLRTWAATMRQASRVHHSTWKNLVATSLLPLMPTRTGNRLDRFRQGGAGPKHFYRGDLATAMQARLRFDSRQRLPLYRQQQLDALRTCDLFNPEPWALHRLVLRDPTADRRVVRAALALSPEQIASAYDSRPIYERAFADLMPRESLRQPKRGHQSADWNQVIDVAELRTAVLRYADHRLVRETIDTDALLGALEHWPEGVCVEGPVEAMLVRRALPAISLASFLALHFPS